MLYRTTVRLQFWPSVPCRAEEQPYVWIDKGALVCKVGVDGPKGDVLKVQIVEGPTAGKQRFVPLSFVRRVSPLEQLAKQSE